MKTIKLLSLFILLTGWCYSGCGYREIYWKFYNTSMPETLPNNIIYVQGNESDTIQIICYGNNGCSGGWRSDSLLKNNVKNSDLLLLVKNSAISYKFACSEGNYRIFFHNTNISAHMGGRILSFIISPVNYVGVSELYYSENFLNVYPNPASKQISIAHTTQQILEINLHNTMGELVLTTSPNNNQTNFNVEELPRGVYYLTAILEDKKRLTKKIIIE